MSAGTGHAALERNDPYLILLRRELTKAQARLRRTERERDRAIAALARLQKSNGRKSIGKTARKKAAPSRAVKKKKARR
jgi:uncharacterized protein (DUF58 family)